MDTVTANYLTEILEFLQYQSQKGENYWVAVGVPLMSGLLGIIGALSGVLFGVHLNSNHEELKRERLAAALMVYKINSILNYIYSARRHMETVFEGRGYIKSWFDHLEEFVGDRPVQDSIGSEEMWLLVKYKFSDEFTKLKELENVCHIVSESFSRYNAMREEVARTVAPFTTIKTEGGRVVARSTYTSKQAPYVPRLQILCNSICDQIYAILLDADEGAEEVSVSLNHLIKSNEDRWKLKLRLAKAGDEE